MASPLSPPLPPTSTPPISALSPHHPPPLHPLQFPPPPLTQIKFSGNTKFFDNHPSKASLLSLADKKLVNGKKKLTKVDKMLYSTTTPETPMIINTLLIMDGKVPFEDMKAFLNELAMAHPRLRMTVKDFIWKPVELDLDEMVHYHRCPAGVHWKTYVDKKNLLSHHLDTSKHLWEVHGILTNENKVRKTKMSEATSEATSEASRNKFKPSMSLLCSSFCSGIHCPSIDADED